MKTKANKFDYKLTPKVVPEKPRPHSSYDTPIIPAAILPVEKLLSNILALCNCYSFLSNTLQNMLRRNS